MRTRTSPAHLALAAASLLTACASSHESPEEAARAFAEAHPAAICDYAVRCEAELASFASVLQETCHPEALHYALPSIARGEVRLDATSAERCLGALRSIPCRVSLEEVFESSPSAACNGALTGTLPEGAPCDPSAAFDGCDESSYCASIDGCEARCVARPGEGEACAGRTCAAGLSCSPADSTCIAIRSPGEACDADDVCRMDAPDAWQACVDGICQDAPAREPGEACGPGVARCATGAYCGASVCVAHAAQDEDCAERRCLPGLRCDATTMRCGERVGAGGACTSSGDCLPDAPHCAATDVGPSVCSASPVGSACDPSVRSLVPTTDPCPADHRCTRERRCAREVALGGACDDRRPCASRGRCIDARCVAVIDAAQSCGPDALCPASHRCIDGACAPLPVLGEPCDGACFEGLCIGGRCALGAPGEACVPDRWSSQCEGACSAGICVDAVGEGDACGVGVGRCAAGLACAERAAGGSVCLAACGA